ncbi:MAG: type II secretion system protein GspD [Gemmatimonadetes bacterium]|nr:type II secretion system protein GspD [Gemmatimonadota bacterium]
MIRVLGCLRIWVCCTALVALTGVTPASAQDSLQIRQFNDSISFRFVDTDLRSVLQALGRYLDRPLFIGITQPVQVTVETPRPVSRAGLLDLIRGLVESNGLELRADSAFYRVQSKTATGPPPPLPVAATNIQGEPIELSVIKLKHAKAANVASTIGALFGISAGGATTGFSSGTLTDELRRGAIPPAAGPGQPAPQPPEGTRVAQLRGAVVIVPDELTNSLLVRSGRSDFAVIDSAVQQLDLRPLQALIEVLIVEVRKARAFSLGADASARALGFDHGDGTLKPSLVGGGLGEFALEVMKLGSFDLDATIRAAVSRGDARIVSRPVLLASNNREARILVGSQRPFVQVSRSLPTETPTRDQVVQYKDVGTKLTVIPTINSDGYVSLMIRQEVNSATNETQFDAPIISTREAETELLVRDRQTVVLGGLKEQQKDVIRSGIPVLSWLPFIGGLFGHQERRTTETELFLFITPRILTDDANAQMAADKALDDAERAGVKRTDLGVPDGPKR